MTRVVAIIQARMGSTRLPGKTLMDLGGKTVLDHVLDRLAFVPELDAIVLATTTNSEDDVIEAHCKQRGTTVFRGHPTDVLDRYHAAAHAQDAEVVVRITADCPLLDPTVISSVVDAACLPDTDYASNVHPQTYPDGLDAEALSSKALDAAWNEARLPSEREHVTPFVWKHPERFRLHSVTHQEDLSHHRWTLDDADDLAFLRAIVARLPVNDTSMAAVRGVLEKEPGLVRTNDNVPRNEGYQKSLQEDKEAAR